MVLWCLLLEGRGISGSYEPCRLEAVGIQGLLSSQESSQLLRVLKQPLVNEYVVLT